MGIGSGWLAKVERPPGLLAPSTEARREIPPPPLVFVRFVTQRRPPPKRSEYLHIFWQNTICELDMIAPMFNTEPLMTAFNSLFVAPLAPAVATVPLSGKSARTLHVYDGVPADAQPWTAAAIAATHQLGPKAAAAVGLLMEPLGMPIGADMSQSRRVARVLGLVTSEGSETLDWGLAQGSVQAFWYELSEATPALVLEFSAPEVLTVAGSLEPFAQEFLSTRCLRQYEAQALSILDNVALPSFAVSLHVAFTGEWGPNTDLLCRTLEVAVHEHFNSFQDLPWAPALLAA